MEELRHHFDGRQRQRAVIFEMAGGTPPVCVLNGRAFLLVFSEM
jgi:hypothetical protein